MGQRPRPEDGLRRAAALAAVRALVGPQLERHARHLGASRVLEQRRDGRIDAAAHRDEHPLPAHRLVHAARRELTVAHRAKERGVRCADDAALHGEHTVLEEAKRCVPIGIGHPSSVRPILER